MPRLVKTIIIQAALGVVSLIFAGIANIIGLAPDNIVDRLFGRDNVKHWANIVMGEMTPDHLRWVAVICGDLFIFLSVLFFSLIPATIAVYEGRELSRKLEKNRKESDENIARVENDFAKYKEWNEGEHKKIDTDIREKEAHAARQLRSARRIHERTRIMLEEMRRRKTEIDLTRQPPT